MDEQFRRIVGQRVRVLRTQAGRSLREQARRTGISPSALSAVENNHGGLSLQRLQRVAEDFGLHVTDLLRDASYTGDDGSPSVEVFERCMSNMGGVRRGRGVLYQLVGPGAGHALQPYILSFEPGGTFENDKIGHLGEEFAYVLHGQVELVLSDARYALEQGDAVRFRTEEPHAFRNLSKAGVALLIGAATPPW